MVKACYFEGLIWCSYRDKFEKELLGDCQSQDYLF